MLYSADECCHLVRARGQIQLIFCTVEDDENDNNVPSSPFVLFFWIRKLKDKKRQSF
jgi:hypothetical protein